MTDGQTIRKRGRITDRQTDRQTDRHTDRQTDRQTDNKKDKTLFLNVKEAAGKKHQLPHFYCFRELTNFFKDNFLAAIYLQGHVL